MHVVIIENYRRKAFIMTSMKYSRYDAKQQAKIKDAQEQIVKSKSTFMIYLRHV